MGWQVTYQWHVVVILSILLFSYLWIYDVSLFYLRGGGNYYVKKKIEEVGLVVNKYKTSDNEVICLLTAD